MNQGQTQPDTTYHVSYKARWDAVDYQLFVFQWKTYDLDWVDRVNIPACLLFKQDADKRGNNTM
jgi:hypothetical protein